MSIVLDGSSLTIDKVVRIARGRETVALAPEALDRIKVCRVMLEEKIRRARSCTAPTPASASSARSC